MSLVALRLQGANESLEFIYDPSSPELPYGVRLETCVGPSITWLPTEHEAYRVLMRHARRIAAQAVEAFKASVSPSDTPLIRNQGMGGDTEV